MLASPPAGFNPSVAARGMGGHNDDDSIKLVDRKRKVTGEPV